MAERATLDELKEFANKVRAAGGGNPIDALMPSVPEEPTMCLIARNLNFNCSVNGVDYQMARDRPELKDAWVMSVNNETTARLIAEQLELEILGYNKDTEGHSVLLPNRIGQVASDFDRAGEVWNSLRCTIADQRAEVVEEWVDIEDLEDITSAETATALKSFSDHERQLLREMIPYIEESKAEAYNLASIIHPDGSISI